VTTWLNTPIQMQFRVIDGLTVRLAQSENRDHHALLLSPWPESLLAFEPMWARLAEHAHLVAIDLQIIAGRRDPAVPPVNAEFLHDRLPRNKLDILDAGHFTWEDAADEYAALVTTWWTGGYTTATTRDPVPRAKEPPP
jgi:pimeloyl-ACP methyl ester carboxylesterase